MSDEEALLREVEYRRQELVALLTLAGVDPAVYVYVHPRVGEEDVAVRLAHAAKGIGWHEVPAPVASVDSRDLDAPTQDGKVLIFHRRRADAFEG